ncbi:hypothetical protein CW304_12140 [Bacillus sp. UFRGS-B20]|nr:hypothetical protein CW304_12140 [Bacillus sp. UFRGS-B20]
MSITGCSRPKLLMNNFSTSTFWNKIEHSLWLFYLIVTQINSSCF